MKDFYTAFFSSTESSQAHRAFCERVFGKDLCQHGFADLEQLHLLMEVTQLSPNHRALDLGCGNGRITEYLCDCTGAHITGLDFIPEAISQAQHYTVSKSERLLFTVGDINQLKLTDCSFDVILSIDSIYFSQNYTDTIRNLAAALRPNGQMAILYSYGREPWIPKEAFPKEKLLADKTPLAEALQANGLVFQTWDLTRQDYELAQRRKEVLTELKPQFDAEGTMFIYDNRLGDAQGISQAIEDGLHARYLYYIQLAEPG
ncbi:MAG: methyltransferase domain-containing protein [Anaerolineaceae bacterium]|nr:methyltransferase domain-containing protein [Anaerolineaceae bacterium]